MTDLKPLSLFYFVRITAAATETAGGLLLPETARENDSEAEVIAAGPGLDLGSGHTSVMQAAVGERVLFRRHDFHALTPGEGFVSDDKLVAIHGADGAVWPLNDWVLITPSAREQVSAGGIHYADGVGKRHRRGVVEDWGSGKLNRSGKMRGTRTPVPSQTGRWYEPKVVYWDDRAESVAVTDGDGMAFILVRADDLIAYEEMSDVRQEEEGQEG